MVWNLRSRVQGLDLPVVGYFPVRFQEFFHVYRTRNLNERVGDVYISVRKYVCIGERKIECLEGNRRDNRTTV
jgi:hypothetical protein